MPVTNFILSHFCDSLYKDNWFKRLYITYTHLYELFFFHVTCIINTSYVCYGILSSFHCQGEAVDDSVWTPPARPLILAASWSTLTLDK